MDRTRGIYAVLNVEVSQYCSSYSVQYMERAENMKCESNQCQVNMNAAQRSVIVSSQCEHIRSVSYWPSSAEPVTLKEDIWTQMEKARRFGEEKNKLCLAPQQHTICETCVNSFRQTQSFQFLSQMCHIKAVRSGSHSFREEQCLSAILCVSYQYEHVQCDLILVINVSIVNNRIHAVSHICFFRLLKDTQGVESLVSERFLTQRQSCVH